MSKIISNRAVALILTVVLFLGLTIPSEAASPVQPDYNPQINPADFTTEITNKYFSLPIGKKMLYEAQTKDGVEKIEIQIVDETRNIMGVTTLLYWDQVWLNGQLQEDTKDWLAQDKEGNVWYFGEEVNNFEDGQLKDHAGSWTAGVDGALPGIWIKANQKVGDSYRQEYYQGQAEDMRDVLAVDQTVTTKLATYKGCVKVYDWTPLDPQSKEHKYYCPEVEALVLNEHQVGGKRTELTDLAYNGKTESVDNPLINNDKNQDQKVESEKWPRAVGLGIVGLVIVLVMVKRKEIVRFLGKKSAQ